MEKPHGFVESIIRSWVSKKEKVTPTLSLASPASEHRVVCAVVQDLNQKGKRR